MNEFFEELSGGKARTGSTLWSRHSAAAPDFLQPFLALGVGIIAFLVQRVQARSAQSLCKVELLVNK